MGIFFVVFIFISQTCLLSLRRIHIFLGVNYNVIAFLIFVDEAMGQYYSPYYGAGAYGRQGGAGGGGCKYSQYHIRLNVRKPTSQPAYIVRPPSARHTLSGHPSARHTLSGHHRPANETPFKWRFAGAPIVARFRCLLGVWLCVTLRLRSA